MLPAIRRHLPLAVDRGGYGRRNGLGRDFAQQPFLETDVRFGSKADMSRVHRHVRFTPKSGH